MNDLNKLWKRDFKYKDGARLIEWKYKISGLEIKTIYGKMGLAYNGDKDDPKKIGFFK